MRCLPAEKFESDRVEEPLFENVRSDEPLMGEFYFLRFDWNQTAEDFSLTNEIFSVKSVSGKLRSALVSCAGIPVHRQTGVKVRYARSTGCLHARNLQDKRDETGT